MTIADYLKSIGKPLPEHKTIDLQTPPDYEYGFNDCLDQIGEMEIESLRPLEQQLEVECNKIDEKEMDRLVHYFLNYFDNDFANYIKSRGADTVLRILINKVLELTSSLNVKQSKPELQELDEQQLSDFLHKLRVNRISGGEGELIRTDIIYEIQTAIRSKFGCKAVMPIEIELYKAHSKAILDWMNYDRSSNYQQHSIRIGRDEFMVKAIIKHLEALRS